MSRRRPPAKRLRKRNVGNLIKQVESKGGKKVRRVEVAADGTISMTFENGETPNPATNEWFADMARRGKR